MDSSFIPYPFSGEDDREFYKKMPLTDYVIWCLGREISDDQLDLLEEAFLDKWNNSTGKMLGDGDTKNHVYHYLQSLNLEVYPPQDLVDEVVDLMLDYMQRIGQWEPPYYEN